MVCGHLKDFYVKKTSMAPASFSGRICRVQGAYMTRKWFGTDDYVNGPNIRRGDIVTVVKVEEFAGDVFEVSVILSSGEIVSFWRMFGFGVNKILLPI